MLSGIERNKLKIGLKEVLKAIGENRAEKVFVADDCEDPIKLRISEAAGEAGVKLDYAESMRDLGKLCGIDVGASCAAILKL